MKAASPRQMDFETLLAETDRVNANRVLARETAHLPATMDEAVPFFRGLIDRHHAAMLAADASSAMAIRSEAEQLATKLNGFEPGYLADDDAPGCVLDRKTRARKGKVPLWGQSGAFEVTVQADEMPRTISAGEEVRHDSPPRWTQCCTFCWRLG
ncbi:MULTISPECIES: hypothetical protein [unclassified Bradyrhizobium]|uniref:hypothetical protein n=1 Tax=unclassified Bradyrhizobium TaxID=2631580 RepID=UPI0028E2022E|nr:MULTISPECIES: hypothetical protein [unclassified Bradyrhizobium]